MRHLPRPPRAREGFTLAELLVTLGILGILAALVLVAVNPDRHLGTTTDAGRVHAARQLQDAEFQYLIDHGAYAADKPIPEGEQLALPICRAGHTAAGCINVDALVPDYLACLPRDGAEADSAASGYRIHQHVGRVRVVPAYLGSGAAVGGCDAPLAADLTTGIISYHTMEEATGATRLDSSGNGHTLSDRSGTADQVAGKIGYAATTSIVKSLERAIVPPPQQFVAAGSVGFWFKPFDFSSAPANYGKTVIRALNSEIDGQWAVAVLADGTLRFHHWSGGSSRKVDTPAGVITAGVWNHVVVTWDGATYAVYINGLSRALTITTPAPVFASSFFGTGYFDAQYTCAGDLDSLGVYSRALSARDVARWYNGGSGYDPF